MTHFSISHCFQLRIGHEDVKRADPEDALAMATTTATTTTTNSMKSDVDESSLLSESENLLASLDAAAFGQPPRAATARAAKKRAAPELTRSAELRLLRQAAAELESQLVLLRQQSRSSMLVRDKRVLMWQQLAARQLRMRQLAEGENARLKAQVGDLLNGDALPAITKQLQLDLWSSMRPPSPSRGLRSPTAAVAFAGVFDSLLARLDAGFAEADAVYRENGLDENLTEPRSFAEKKTRRLGQPCQYLQLSDLRLSPFPWLRFGETTWRSNYEWHRRASRYEHPCGDSTFAVNYRVAHKTLGDRQSLNYKFVMRRYILPDRVVLVLATQCDGENELAGAGAHAIGFLAMRNVDLHSDNDDASAAPVTVVQSCLQIFPTPHASDDNAAQIKTRNLVSLMSNSFEDDVTFMRQNVDSLLLRETRGGRSEKLAASDGLSPQLLRITFRGADPVC